MATLGNPLGGGTDPFGNSSTWARQWAGGGPGGYGGYGGPANTLPPGYGMTPGMFAGYGGYPAASSGGAGGGLAPTTPGGAWWQQPKVDTSVRYNQPYTPDPNAPPVAWQQAQGWGLGTPGRPGMLDASALAQLQANAATPLPGQQQPETFQPPASLPGQQQPETFQPPPPPPQAGQPGANLFSGYDDLGQLYWNQNPGQAWAHAWSQLGPNVASPYWNWGMQQQSRYNDQYLAQAALPGNANMTFTDFINQHAPGFASEFGNLPASQRGVTLPYLAAGRLG